MKILSNGMVMYSKPIPADSRIAHVDPLEDQPEQRQRPTVVGIEAGESVPAAGLQQMLWNLQAGPEETVLVPDSAPRSASDTLLDELHKWASMTIGEKIRAQYLEDHNLTEQDVAALPSEEREAIEAAIRDQILRQAGVEDSNSGESPVSGATVALLPEA